MDTNKDNPVPSINDVYEFMNLNKNYKSYSEKQKTIMIDSFYLMLNTLNLNGVETNKEQPKKKEPRSTVVMRSNCSNWDDLRHCFKVYKGQKCTCT